MKYDYFGPKALNCNKAVNPSTLSRLMQMVHFWPIKRFGKGHETVLYIMNYFTLHYPCIYKNRIAIQVKLAKSHQNLRTLVSYVRILRFKNILVFSVQTSQKIWICLMTFPTELILKCWKSKLKLHELFSYVAFAYKFKEEKE